MSFRNVLNRLPLVAALVLLAASGFGQLPRPQPVPPDPHSAQQQQQPQEPRQSQTSSDNTQSQTPTQTFRGTIVKSQGSYVLKDTAAHDTFQLDDQDKAKAYEGKEVSVTGTLDYSTKMIHVSAIVPVS